MEYNIIEENIITFLKEQLNKANKTNFVLGVSGGIDSTLVLALASKAIKEVTEGKIYSFYLPFFDKKSNIEHEIASYYNSNIEVISIKPIINVYDSIYNIEFTQLNRGNTMARTRMTILYAFASFHNALVLNTCNLSEDLIGYSTKFGDGAGDLAPIAHLTKTEIYKLAEYISIPEIYINRKPSAELWEGQTDEKELGFTYSFLDKFIEIYRNDNTKDSFGDWLLKFAHKNNMINGNDSRLLTKIYGLAKNAEHKLNTMPKLQYKRDK